MSTRSEPAPGLLVASVIYRSEDRFDMGAGRLAEIWGPPSRVSDPFPFDRTGYYRREMGDPLHRRFFVGSGTVGRGELPEIKRSAEGIEHEFSEEGRRTLNIDPGILTEENFILATGKNYSHRVYLREGVYADLTLMYRGGQYVPLPWTYPDYASEEIRGFLGEIREQFRRSRMPQPG